MAVIYKYPLLLRHENYLDLPPGAKLLSCQEQNEQVTLWFQLEQTDQEEERLFVIHGTGCSWSVPEGFKDVYQDTIVMKDGMVWHVYERVLRFNPDKLLGDMLGVK